MLNGAFRAFVVRWGDLAWRLVAIGVVVFFAFRILKTVSVVVFAVVFAMFLAAILWRPTQWLVTKGWKPALAAIATLLMSSLVLAGLIVFIIPQIGASVETLSRDVTETWETFHDWLIEGPLGLTQAEIDEYTQRIGDWLQSFGGENLLGGAAVVLEFVTGAFLVVIITFFLLKDGRSLLQKTLDRSTDDAAHKISVSARVARDSLAQYMGGVALVGVFDATLIGIALWIVGAPLVFPLALLVFFGAFIPLIGAFVSGLLAVAVTFVNVGPVQALIILGVVIVVQQFEGDVIMPLVFGSRLRLHPLVVLLAVTAGGLAFGLAGAFLAVPLIAVAVSIHEEISVAPEDSYLSLARG
ncbi:MAG TPA: AI-2E family transporter [Acidimicrobiia bacterium]|nr:AI-2E family transporter [Acidimicrobiia bacterium]